jgi:hypothetical protein
MKAFSTKSLRKNLARGLRKFAETDEQTAGLVECHNLVPREDGLQVFDPMTSLNANGVSWGGEGISPGFDPYPSDVLEFWDDDVEFSIMR